MDVILAKAAAHFFSASPRDEGSEIPAFAGMTELGDGP
jgi:hypothetical protein